MDATTLWAVILGTLCIVLGFIALLSSRVYIDKDSNSTVEVEVPFFGKLKGNYPALVFVLLGAALAAYGIKTNAELRTKQIETAANIELKKGQEDWVVSGRLLSPNDKPVDWEHGVFTLISGTPEVNFKPGGGFEIKLKIEHGQDFEHYVQQIDYTNDIGSAKIFPQQELDALTANKSSLLENKTANTRVYKPVKLQAFNE